MSRDKNVPNWDRCQFCIAEGFVKRLRLQGPAIGPLGAFHRSVNVATTAAVGPVPNVNKAGATGASALLALPSRSLVGFLSLLNGLLGPADEDAIPAASSQSAKPRTTDSPPRRSGENEKGGKDVPHPPTDSAGSVHALSLPAGPNLSGVPASLPAPASTIPPAIPSFARFRQISRETTPSNMTVTDTALAAQLQPSESLDKPATGVAFALHLTPQTAAIRGTPVVAPQTRTQVAAAPTATISNRADAPSSSQLGSPPEFGPAEPPREHPIQVSNPQKPANPAPAPAPSSAQPSAESPQAASPVDPALARPRLATDSEAHSGSQEKNIEPARHSENPQPRPALQVSPRSTVITIASNNIDSPSQTPEATGGPKPSAQSPRVDSEADTLPRIAAQPLIETPETSAPSATEKEQPRAASQVQSGTLRIATRKTSTEQENTYVKSHTDSPNQKGSSQGEDMNDAGAGAKSPRPDLPEKPAPSPKDRVQETTGQLSVFPAAATGANRTALPSETAPVDPPVAGRVSTEIETNPSVRPQPIREISLRIADKASNSVDIQMVERAGHVQVAVRTPDQELTKSLQTNLGELVGRLEQKGYKTETWVPGTPLHTPAAMAEPTSSSGHNQDQPGHSSSWDGGQQQQQEQESGRRQQARWMTQLEQTLNGEEAGTEGIPMEDQ